MKDHTIRKAALTRYKTTSVTKFRNTLAYENETTICTVDGNVAPFKIK
jgi:hypothetical protein